MVISTSFWQVHLPAPKSIDRPHYQVTTPNEMHQFDLLYMPSDTLYGNKYKYIPKRVDRPHYEVTIPNEMHQFDLLYMPSDSLYGSKYKYILAGIDAASRFGVARPLRTKQASDVDISV